MKRKTISLLTQVAIVATLLSGCGSANPDAAQTEASTEKETETEASKEAEPAAETTQETAEPITITYANFNASGGNEATLNSMYQAFHKSR